MGSSISRYTNVLPSDMVSHLETSARTSPHHHDRFCCKAYHTCYDALKCCSFSDAEVEYVLCHLSFRIIAVKVVSRYLGKSTSVRK